MVLRSPEAPASLLAAAAMLIAQGFRALCSGQAEPGGPGRPWTAPARQTCPGLAATCLAGPALWAPKLLGACCAAAPRRQPGFGNHAAGMDGVASLAVHAGTKFGPLVSAPAAKPASPQDAGRGLPGRRPEADPGPASPQGPASRAGPAILTQGPDSFMPGPGRLGAHSSLAGAHSAWTPGGDRSIFWLPDGLWLCRSPTWSSPPAPCWPWPLGVRPCAAARACTRGRALTARPAAVLLWARVSKIKVAGAGGQSGENGRQYLLEEEQRGEDEVQPAVELVVPGRSQAATH